MLAELAQQDILATTSAGAGQRSYRHQSPAWEAQQGEKAQPVVATHLNRATHRAYLKVRHSQSAKVPSRL
jgi:hypothetical protein